MDDDSLSEAILSTEPTLGDDDNDADASSMAATEQSSISPHPAPLSTPNTSVFGADDANRSHACDSTTTDVSSKRPIKSTELRKPLTLLDLPLDILREIVKEITLTHDLTSLARACSALHALAIPAMYSRFDIVWPEPTPVSDQPVGVDALSYGLATLVMGANAFKGSPQASSLFSRHSCHHCGCDGSSHHQASPQAPTSPLRTKFGQFRIGNSYAQYTKKFCVGNGPSEWVRDYAITRETGKLLGTLVALAVSRMVNLESFIWDMPTGVMRDVFLALASFDTRLDRECRLEKVWVRWHDNSRKLARFPSDNSFLPARTNPMGLYRFVEYPTFSVLPPLRSLSVLNIDEPTYLEEMAILIERSRHKLRELRIGMQKPFLPEKWVYPIEIAPPSNGREQREVPNWPKPGGVLSILLATSNTKHTLPAEYAVDEPRVAEDDVAPAEQSGDVHTTSHLFGHLTVDDAQEPQSLPPQSTTSVNSGNDMKKSLSVPQAIHGPANEGEVNEPQTLNLETLELEYVVIHTPTLIKAVDWTRLATLTILNCEEHESLWKALRRKYPTPAETKKQDAEDTTTANYPFKLKHLHTDRVSTFLMLFLKESIAPNSLESVYFQESNSYTTNVSIEAIYKHVLRRHRASLRKVLIDRSRHNELVSSINGHWRGWMLSREALAFVTSGRMPQLRELGIGMDRRDWHFFLQRLPKLVNLRALYLPNMCDSTLGRNKHRELAMQILDIVTLRPEIQLCYIGIEDKCFEILEVPVGDRKGNNGIYRDSPWFSDSDSESGEHTNGQGSEFNSEDEDDDDDNDDDDNNSDNMNSITDDDDDDDDDIDDIENHDGISSSRFVFRLREILFYDDKISVFKARHCSL